MQAGNRRANPVKWLTAHTVEVAFGLLVLGWLLYVRRITGQFSFWADDLRVIDQAGSWSGLIKPYNGALSLVSMVINRAAADASSLSYTPFMLAGALSLVAVPVSYFLTTRRQFGPPLAAILAVPLLWNDGMDLRPAGLNHFLALVGAIICAAALNRGRRADGVLGVALLFSLCAAGEGLVVVGACLLHSLLVRAPLRRWFAILVPAAIYGFWWVTDAHGVSPKARSGLTTGQAVRVVRDLLLAPFYQVGFGMWPVAALLLVAFLLYGSAQLRHGLVAGANFLVWSAAMLMWALALVQSRGVLADPQTFRYAYLSLGFALLALVPRRPIKWPASVSPTNPRWLAAAAVIVLGFGGVRALHARPALQRFAKQNSEYGREAKGTLLVLQLGPDIIPDTTPITFFGFFGPHGTAGQVRTLLDRYGSPVHAATRASIDRKLVDLRIARSRQQLSRRPSSCRPLTGPLSDPGYVARGLGRPGPSSFVTPTSSVEVRLWSSQSFTVEVRRFGSDWIRLARVSAGRVAYLDLPALDAAQPWEISADGACVAGS